MEAFLPPKVAAEIAKHLRSAGKDAEQGWQSASADEDTLTGDFGAMLRRKFHWTSGDGGKVWGWGVDYAKFGGRGEGAPESALGADGIFQITLRLRGSREEYQKGLLFQSKKVGTTKLGELKKQGQDMEDIVPGGSCIFEFGPNAYRGCDTTDALQAQSLKEAFGKANQIGSYLADRFFKCKRGKMGMFYDGGRQTLVVPDETKGVRRVKGLIKHRMNIEVVRSD